MYVIAVLFLLGAVSFDFNCTFLNILVICFVSIYKTLKSEELGKRWKTISSDEKVEWQADADARKETYMQDVAAYEKANPTAKAAKKKVPKKTASKKKSLPIDRVCCQKQANDEHEPPCRDCEKLFEVLSALADMVEKAKNLPYL